MPWSYIGILMRHLAAEPRSTAVPFSVYLWNDLSDPVMIFYWPRLLYPYYSLLLFSLSLLPVYRLVLWGWGLRTDRVFITLSQPCTADLF